MVEALVLLMELRGDLVPWGAIRSTPLAKQMQGQSAVTFLHRIGMCCESATGTNVVAIKEPM